MYNYLKRKASALFQPNAGALEPDEDQSTEPLTDNGPESTGLFVLHGENVLGDVSRAVDIVAVHGLGGHYKDTWTSDNGAFWLKDFLPKQLSDSNITTRIFSYGYNAETLVTSSGLDIVDVARNLLHRIRLERESTAESRRPIVFIAHSLGGIIVKKVSGIVPQSPKS